MSRVKNADRDLLILKLNDETGIYARAVCCDGIVPEGFLDE